MGKTLRYEFDFLDRDNVSTNVKYFSDGSVEIENFTDDIVLRAFGVREVVTEKDLEEFLEDRSVPRSRANIRQLMKDANMQFYNPIEWVRLNHGTMCDDTQWVRFAGENLTWEDVNPMLNRVVAKVIDK